MEHGSIALATLASPPVLFFVLGLAAAFIRSDLKFPEAFAKWLSLFLIMAIGFKGGAEMARASLGDIIPVLLAGVVLSAALPALSFGLLRATTSLPRVDMAAIAAHYGSISIVTFIAASDAARMLQLDTGGAMVAVAAAMEAPAILTGLLLAGAAGRSGGLRLAEPLTNGSIVLLLGAFAIGWISGETGMAAVAPLFVDAFRGVLCLFLLDMGLIAGRGLVEHGRKMRPGVVLHGLYMPLIAAGIALAIARGLGLAPGNAALLMTLAASASYIAVPAAMRLALPKARPALSLTLSLGITFPFNLLIGIPLYFTTAQMVLGGVQ